MQLSGMACKNFAISLHQLANLLAYRVLKEVVLYECQLKQGRPKIIDPIHNPNF